MMPHEHAMIGPGGAMRIPKSETAVLLTALERLRRYRTVPAPHILEQVIDSLQELVEQVSQGFHRNPRSHLRFQAGTVVGKIGDDVHDVRYRHAKDGKNYEHEFGGEVEVYAVERNGKRDLLLTHVRGLPLWDEF